MSNFILTTDAIREGVKIEAPSEGYKGRARRWRVVGRNKLQKDGWDIRDGHCTRLIFPDDFIHYHLL